MVDTTAGVWMIGPTRVLRLRLKIEIRGINPYVPISAAYAARLRKGWRKPMPVRVQINGKPAVPWRINMMPRGDGGFWLYLAGVVRKASGSRVGDVVSVSVQFDAQYRAGPNHPIPLWFERRLARNPGARAGWERLPPSRQKELLRYFAALKTPEAQTRNARRAVQVLAGARGRFMARDWNSGRK
jgi:hypothetical protein